MLGHPYSELYALPEELRSCPLRPPGPAILPPKYTRSPRYAPHHSLVVVGQFSKPTYHSFLTHTSLFPLAVLALELPQYMRQKPCFYASMATQITVHVYSIYFASIHLGNDGRRFWELVSYLLLFMATSSVLPQIWAYVSPPGPASRAVVNALYFGDLIMPFLVYRITLPWNAWEKLDWSTKCAYLVGYVNASMFGIAALLYGIAWVRRHAWVPSRSLGGSGIEPMVLIIPGRGPLYQSIGDEAGEGVIRLV
jgi:hypothetical protein